MDKSAIEQIQALAIQASTLTLPDNLALVHSDFALKRLEPFQLGRERLRGEYTTDLIADFVAFLQRHAQGDIWIPVFVHSELPRATAIINYVESETVPIGHCDFQAHIRLKLSAEKKAAQTLGEDRFNQKAAAEFLEDWVNNLRFVAEGGEDIPAAAAINSIRKVKIEQIRSVESEARQFGAEKSEFEKIEATAQQMPSFVEFTILPHPELSVRVYRYRVNVLTSGSEPQFRFAQIGKDREEAELLEEFRQKLKAAIEGTIKPDAKDPGLGAKVDLFSGEFKP